MTLVLRLGVASTCVALSALSGWWLHTPSPFIDQRPSDDTAISLKSSLQKLPGSAEDLAQRIATIDPFGIKRNVSAPAGLSGSASPSTVQIGEPISWRISALVVRGSEHYLILTAPNQVPLRVAEGEKLPDGDTVKSISSDHAVIQGKRGRNRTIYLTEP